MEPATSTAGKASVVVPRPGFRGRRFTTKEHDLRPRRENWKETRNTLYDVFDDSTLGRASNLTLN